MSWHKKLLWVLLCITASVGMAAADDSSGFLSVTGPCRMEFPRDHAPHPGFRTEWWYWTGNLKSETGRHFGFQLTFFRYQLTPFGGAAEWPEPRSAWRSRQIYIGHAALSDLSAKRHFQAEQVGREALGLGGWVQWGPDITFFLRDWSAVILPDSQRPESRRGRLLFQSGAEARQGARAARDRWVQSQGVHPGACQLLLFLQSAGDDRFRDRRGQVHSRQGRELDGP